MGAASSHFDGTGSRLVQAAKTGDASAVVELISANPVLLQYTTRRHLSPAHYAARSPNADVLQQLLCKAEEVEFVSACKQQQSSHGRQHRQANIVHKLVNAASDRGVTPLMLAVDRGCYQTVKLLLDKGADPWAVDKLGGRTALHYAARSQSVEVMQLLIDAAGEHGPVNFPNRPNVRYVDVRTQSGFSAVHFAVHANAPESLAVLISNGANIMLSSLFDSLDSISCSRGSTPMHLAARLGNIGIAKQLLKAWVDIWHRRNMPDMRLVMDGNDQLPCQIAARRDHLELARILLPTSPIASVIDGSDALLGPPSLARIAGAVLRKQLATDLEVLQPAPSAAAAEASAAAVLTECVADPAPAGASSQPQEAGEAVQPQEADEVAGQCCPAAPAALAGAHSASAPVVVADDCAACSSSSCCSDCSDGDLCGVCFDTAAAVALQPCGHNLCVSCCQHLLALDSRCVLTCPFCRAGVAHLAAVPRTEEEAAAAAAAAPPPRDAGSCLAGGAGVSVVAHTLPAAAASTMLAAVH